MLLSSLNLVHFNYICELISTFQIFEKKEVSLTLSGNIRDKAFLSRSNTLRVTFYSDSYTRAKGFVASVQTGKAVQYFYLYVLLLGHITVKVLHNLAYQFRK